MNGKGDTPRPTDGDQYRANYDAICWSVPQPSINNSQQLLRRFGYTCTTEETRHPWR